MFRPRRHRLPLALRVFVLGLLALGLLMKPVLASIGELHELAHDPTGTHALAGHGDHVSGVSQDEDPQGERGLDSLHALIHFAHCCGQSSLASLPAIEVLAAPPSADVLLMSEPQVLSQTLSIAPFRPPITT
jgi:hypothetical protein